MAGLRHMIKWKGCFYISYTAVVGSFCLAHCPAASWAGCIWRAREPQASWTEQQFHGKVRHGAVGGQWREGAHHLELIGVFLKSEAITHFLPSFSRPWNGSHLGLVGAGSISFTLEDVVLPNPWAHSTPRQPGTALCQAPFHRLSVNTLNCLSEIPFSTPPAIFWPPLISASGLRCSPSLHRGIGETEKAGN